MTILH